MLLSLLTMSTLTAGKIVSEGPLLSDSNPDVKPPLQTFSLRPMTLNDISILAGQSAEAYWYVVKDRKGLRWHIGRSERSRLLWL